jgi:hypothetical protein
MNQSRIAQLIERLKFLRREAAAIESELSALGIPSQPLIDENTADASEQRLHDLEQQEAVFQALSRVDYNDDHYTFIRAIDGDTIVVNPPSELRRWMKDVRIRLYGLETPELWEELGAQYQKHLEDLCSIDAGGRLMVVWERERPSTQYEGFPLSSFERGIGHVFFRTKSSQYLYVNGLMHLLKHSTLLREEKNLLRGRRTVGELGMDLPYSGRCHTPLPTSSAGKSPTFELISAMAPPVCLVAFPSLPILDPRIPDFGSRIAEAISKAWTSGCPFSHDLHRKMDTISTSIANQSASPFDLPLTHVSMWAARQHQ